jgi:hypothetical protein
MSKKTKLDWVVMQNRQEKAIERAAEVLGALKIASPPVDPLAIAESERPFLRVAGGDFRNRFDGQLEYHRSKNRFLLFYNTKYDACLPPGQHHPRTRFSMAHELGHYFLEAHHAHLHRTGKSHPSRGEFLSDRTIETEADAFAAGLLMPSALLGPLANRGNLTFSQIEAWASTFKTSVTSTARRSIELSDFPCALIGVREGRVAFAFHSRALIEGGCYPRPRGSDLPRAARPKWQAFLDGGASGETGSALARDWCQTYDCNRASEAPVDEYYYGVPSMQTLLVLLTVAEDDLFPDTDDD